MEYECGCFVPHKPFVSSSPSFPLLLVYRVGRKIGRNTHRRDELDIRTGLSNGSCLPKGPQPWLGRSALIDVYAAGVLVSLTCVIINHSLISAYTSVSPPFHDLARTSSRWKLAVRHGSSEAVLSKAGQPARGRGSVSASSPATSRPALGIGWRSRRQGTLRNFIHVDFEGSDVPDPRLFHANRKLM